MTTKEIYELSCEINDRLSDYRHDMASAIIVLMNERRFNEIYLRKMREDCEQMGLDEVAERFKRIANNHVVDICNYNGETVECYIDSLEIKDAGFVYCVFSGVQDPDFEITKNLRNLNIQAIISVMEWVAEYFDTMDEMVSEQ